MLEHMFNQIYNQTTRQVRSQLGNCIIDQIVHQTWILIDHQDTVVSPVTHTRRQIENQTSQVGTHTFNTLRNIICTI